MTLSLNLRIEWDLKKMRPGEGVKRSAAGTCSSCCGHGHEPRNHRFSPMWMKVDSRDGVNQLLGGLIPIRKPLLPHSLPRIYSPATLRYTSFLTLNDPRSHPYPGPLLFAQSRIPAAPLTPFTAKCPASIDSGTRARIQEGSPVKKTERT